jgi:hypothetical protein
MAPASYSLSSTGCVPFAILDWNSTLPAVTLHPEFVFLLDGHCDSFKGARHATVISIFRFRRGRKGFIEMPAHHCVDGKVSRFNTINLRFKNFDG